MSDHLMERLEVFADPDMVFESDATVVAEAMQDAIDQIETLQRTVEGLMRCEYCHLAETTGHFQGCPNWTPETHAEIARAEGKERAMMEPTKERVLKRLAEIEGCERVEFDSFTKLVGWEHPDRDGMWNPLDNPADTFALIEKYRLSIECFPYGEVGWVWRVDEDADHPSLPYAIALAVIEANGGMVEEEAE